jgi:NADH-quinone oxidoreductase subunit L
VVAAAWVCLLSPLAAVVALVLAGTRISRRVAAYLATLSVAVSFGGAVVAFVELVSRDENDRHVVSTAFTWLSSGNLNVGLSILVDPLAVFEMLVVSGVGALIVAYSIGYMDGADEERRYFAYMALFVFSMLLLVQASNFVLLLAGWGLVGLCSYLLIGFEHERPAAVTAAKKAFIMNALGDATMVLALFLLFWRTGSLDYDTVFAGLDGMSSTALTLVALGLLGGAVAKSAQIPLHTWLPDAMEGPTPVSALIHAATMVTAGVYLIVRLNPIYEAAPHIQDLAAGIGALTLLVAGLIALVQTDIKRVIAYSTMSQIGYMFVGAGVGAYGNAMFHLMTHAFFKALLFLAAGIVIHALLGEQDMRKMGGLGRLLPRTRAFFLVGALALAGMPPLSGFFSKDAIIASTLARGDTWGDVLFAAGIVGAFLTGLYAFRMVFIVFGGQPSAYAREHFHAEPGREGPFSMVWTVAALAVLATIGGWVQIPGLWSPLADFLDPVAEPLVDPTARQDWLTSLVAVAAGLAGIALAWLVYSEGRLRAPSVPLLRTLLEHKFFFDQAYDLLFYRPAALTARLVNRWVEGTLIRGSVMGVAGGARELGEEVSHAQTGLLRTYAMVIAAGLAVLALVFVSVR